MGEIAYNRLGKNTHLPARGPSGSYPFGAKSLIFRLDFFINNLGS